MLLSMTVQSLWANPLCKTDDSIFPPPTQYLAIVYNGVMAIFQNRLGNRLLGTYYTKLVMITKCVAHNQRWPM